MVLIVGGRKIKATDLRLATMHGMVVGGYDEYGWGWKVDTLGIVRSRVEYGVYGIRTGVGRTLYGVPYGVRYVPNNVLSSMQVCSARSVSGDIEGEHMIGSLPKTDATISYIERMSDAHRSPPLPLPFSPPE